MSDNIKVVVKVRPLISRELEDKQHHQWRVQSNTLYQLDSHGRDFGQSFTFDKVYNEDAKTSDVYNDVAKPIVEAGTAGFNGTIFAYGQTSSGKTYTMTGTETSPGIIPLSVLNLFEIIKNIPNRDFLVRVSYIEIYNETVKDLLDVKKENIKIHETYDGCIKVDASERVTSSPEDVLEAMREGEANRQTGTTNMNEKSSRSHSIFQITIESREHMEGTEGCGCVNVSQLNLVDLAGSERAGQTGATGIRFKEGTHINKSLSALALVIKQLSEDPNKYVNYRDSRLTRILQNSLGGNAKTSIICAITPAALEETISTLQFATRAKAIKNKPEVNAVATDATMIQSLTKKLSRLQSQLESKKNLEVMLENKKNVEQDLQNKIANLQKLILNGFGQRSSIEQVGGARRKQPPRRITISTLHSIDEDPLPAVPKFRTPSLKYNPMTIPTPSDFAPLQSSKLPSLPEERATTPPLNNKKVNFNEDVIEIDSDDDDNSTIPTCSPYHNCYSVSKTPPCVLRKNCHRAEKDYREIVEFTAREKMYQPDVVELMEKLELSTHMTVKLQEEIELLRKNSKEKDLQMQHLSLKIKKSEEDVKNAKMKLEAHTQEYTTKLTDCEVSYDILKNKAKLREEELLSLIEEQKIKKCEDIGKLPPKPLEKDGISFMNMSKDISLVNSDTENSITTSNEEESSEMKNIVASLKDQLIAKCQTIVQLEANIASQKQSIEYLEQSSHDLQKLIDSFKEKNTYLENENILYKSNLNALNDTIKEQKESLKIAQNDIASYINVIRELQIQLTNKINLQNTSVSDSVLENMLANEEKVIANNENMKNIIHSFKIALDNRNKEIEQLKLSIKETENSLNNDINDKIKQIKVLNEEIAELKDNANNNINTINNLMREKSNLAFVEEELTKKMAELENQKMELNELNKENILRIDNLNETNQHLLQSLSDKNAKEQEYIQLNNDFQNKLDEMSHRIVEIEEEINAKNNIISSLNKVNNEKQEYEDHAKSALDKLKSVMSILSGDIKEIPEFIENCVTLYNALSKGLCLLENVANDTVSEKSVVLNENSLLRSEIMFLHNEFGMERNSLQQEIDQQKLIIDNYLKEIVNLKETNMKLSDEISECQIEINTTKDEYGTLLARCDSLKDDTNKLTEELLQRQEITTSLYDKDADYKLKIDDLETQLQHSNAALKTEEDKLKSITEFFTKTPETMEELTSDLKNKQEEVAMLQKSLNVEQVENQQIQNIFNRLCDIGNRLNIESSFSSEDNNLYDCILLLFDKIKNENVINKNDIKRELVESKKSDDILLIANQDLNNKLTLLENKHKSLCDELERNNLDKKCLSKNLIESNELLEQLKKDLEHKALEVQVMESKVQELKDQFTNLDIIMNQRMQDLRYENEWLKTRYRNVEQIQTDSSSEKSHDFTLNKSIRATCENYQLNLKTITPPSLLTICCNRIVDALEPNQHDYNIATQSSSEDEIECQNTAKCATCDHMSLELRILEQEKCSLLGILEQSEKTNKALLLEQEDVRKEVQLLLKPSQELQKKISNLKTNLAILTATTYAENRSLNSQVLALQHHHGKLLNMCQGDIPEFKKQLCDLFVMLKDEPFLSDSQNANLKRYSLPDVLDNNTTVCNFKNESTLDGDLLMLDTNVTITTTGDNTLVGFDQTSLDLTQAIFNEVSCQTNDPKRTEANIVNRHISLLESDSQNMFSSLEVLKEENCKLKTLVDKLSIAKLTDPKADAQSISIKATTFNDETMCTKCQIENKKPVHADTEELNRLTKKLEDLQSENKNMKKKYNDLLLEMPKTDALVSKLKTLENEYNLKCTEVTKLISALNIKNKELKRLQEENDTMSTQVMENIFEADDLNKELNRIKSENLELAEKVRKLDATRQVDKFECPQCKSSLATRLAPNKDSPHAKLNRSLSDTETSSRFNKICTLQSELCAGREDCRDLTEHVATIKQHLNCSNISIDSEECMGDSNVSQSKNVLGPVSQHTICSMPDIQEEQPLDVYTVDKMECYNYYLEVTGEEIENVSEGVKIIDILKMFYNSLLEKHGNEVKELANKLKDYEEFKNSLQLETNELVSKYTEISKTLEVKDENLNRLAEFMSQLKCNINRIKYEFNNKDSESFAEVVNMFKQNFLTTLDQEFETSSASVFDVIMAKCQEEFNAIKKQNAILENKKCNLDIGLDVVKELKEKLVEQESSHNLLKSQKEKMVEISRAVTLDIVRKEQEILKSLNEGCQKLLQHKLITSDLALSESAIKGIDLMIEHIINQSKLNNSQHETEIEKLTFEIKVSTNILDEKEKELNELKTQIKSLRDINNNVTINLADKEEKFQTLKAAYEDLNKSYDSQNQENINKRAEIAKLTEDIISLRETISNKESLISSLSEKNAKTTELLLSIKELQEDNTKLKSVNQMISKEKESYSIDLKKSNDTVKQNIEEIAKMTSDILVLRESVKDATSIIESLKQEIHKLTVVNAELNLSVEEKRRECIRLEMNIKTHDKTAELQSKMIIRLNKQKEEDDRVISETQSKIVEVNEKFNSLRDECEKLRSTKESLEARVSELQEAAERPRASLDAADPARRRRRSIHDSKRVLADLDEHRNLEEVFESRQKVDDLFSEGDDTSGRSTPFGLGRGHDSLLSRTEQSDKDEDHSSRPSSAQAARRRRQSSHDLRRGVAGQAPPPHDFSNRVNEELHASCNRSDSDEATLLRSQLTSCQQELEELKERCKELDDECDTCAEYLKERELQCTKLRKEKTALEKQIVELKSCSPKSSEKPSVAHVAVNTDEDWANLHAVVVDRMSYDAEVDKNKRLTKIIEELRYQKQDLKNTMAKMQAALEKQHSSKDNRELEATKKELKSVKEELEEWKVKYKELDEECETCADYLKEREEQCRRLKEAKAALESKLQALQEDSHTLAHYSARKKRQTAHDKNRAVAEPTDASTDTGEDLTTSQAERPDSSQRGTDDKLREIKRLRLIVDKLSHQKAAMEQQLKTAQPMYVATGSAIVQNQQLTDVMKENQHLKKLNAKLVNMCKKRGKSDANRENEDPCEQG